MGFSIVRRLCSGGHDFLLTATSIAALALTISLPAAAQRAPVPPGAEAGSVEKQLQRLPEPVKPAQSTDTSIVLPEASAPPDAQNIRFTLKELDISGNTQIATPDLQAYAAGLVGHDVSLAQIYDASRQMTARYRDAGFILANVVIPAQKISGGVVHIQVVEGFISKVSVEGDLIRGSLLNAGREQLLAARPLRARDLERFLLLLNDLPGVTAQGILAPSATVPGAAELTVKTAQQKVSVAAGASYRGSELQGPGQIQASVALNSPFGWNDSTSFQYLQSFKARELRLYALTHTERLTSSGLDLSLSGSRSKGEPDLTGSSAAFNLENDFKQVRAELSYPILRTRFTNLKVRAAFTYHDGKTDIIGFPIYEDKISAVRFGVSWDMVDPLGGVNVVDVEYDKGLSAFGSSKINDPLASRAGGDPEFSKATLYLARLQSLGHGFSFLLAADGQTAWDSLLSSEEFAFGGDQFGRAYDPSDLVGDEGYAAKAELRYTRELNNGLGLTLYGFGETGRVTRKLSSIQFGESTHDSATDVGGGLRFTVRTWLTGYVEVARPTNHVITALDRKETRVFGGFICTFGF